MDAASLQMATDHRPRADVRATASTMPWQLAAVVFAATSVMVGLIWDISWHMTIGRDTFWTPAHLAIYTGGAVAGLACGFEVLRRSFFAGATPADGVTVWRLFNGPLGGWLCIWGAVAMLTSAPFDDWWHAAYGLDVKIISPPHALLALGFITILGGALIMAVAEQGREADRREASAGGGAEPAGIAPYVVAYTGGLVLAMLSIFTTEYHDREAMHLGSFYVVSSLVFPFALVAAARSTRLRYGATATALVYTLVMCVQLWLLPLFEGSPKLGPIRTAVTHMVSLDFPLLLLLPAIAIDLLMPRLRERRQGRGDRPGESRCRRGRRSEAGQLVRLDLGGLDVERDVEPHGALAAVGGEPDGFFEVKPDFFRLHHHHRILGNRRGHRGDIDLLLAHGADGQRLMPDEIGALGLTRDEETRRRFDPRARGAGEGVGAARSSRHEGATEAVGELAVSLGGERAALLVQARDVVELRPFPDRIDEVHAPPARKQKDMLESLADQKIDHVIGEFHRIKMIDGLFAPRLKESLIFAQRRFVLPQQRFMLTQNRAMEGDLFARRDETRGLGPEIGERDHRRDRDRKPRARLRQLAPLARDFQIEMGVRLVGHGRQLAGERSWVCTATRSFCTVRILACRATISVCNCSSSALACLWAAWRASRRGNATLIARTSEPTASQINRLRRLRSAGISASAVTVQSIQFVTYVLRLGFSPMRGSV